MSKLTKLTNIKNTVSNAIAYLPRKLYVFGFTMLLLPAASMATDNNDDISTWMTGIESKFSDYKKAGFAVLALVGVFVFCSGMYHLVVLNKSGNDYRGKWTTGKALWCMGLGILAASAGVVFTMSANTLGAKDAAANMISNNYSGADFN